MLEELQLISLLGARSARPADTSVLHLVRQSSRIYLTSSAGIEIRLIVDHGDIAASNLAFIKVRALFTNAHERPDSAQVPRSSRRDRRLRLQ